jgi:hypothetical protein
VIFVIGNSIKIQNSIIISWVTSLHLHQQHKSHKYVIKYILKFNPTPIKILPLRFHSKPLFEVKVSSLFPNLFARDQFIYLFNFLKFKYIVDLNNISF